MFLSGEQVEPLYPIRFDSNMPVNIDIKKKITQYIDKYGQIQEGSIREAFERHDLGRVGLSDGVAKKAGVAQKEEKE